MKKLFPEKHINLDIQWEMEGEKELSKNLVSHKNNRWGQVKDTENRRGSLIPEDGWKKALPGSEYHSDERPCPGWDELKNFLASDIGSLASATTRSNRWGNHIYYWTNAFSCYAPVKRPCQFCEDAGKKQCNHDILVAALTYDYHSIMAGLNNPDDPFPINLSGRKFAVKINPGFNQVPSVPNDRFPASFSDGIMEKVADIKLDKKRDIPSLKKASIMQGVTSKLVNQGMLTKEMWILKIKPQKLSAIFVQK